MKKRGNNDKPNQEEWYPSDAEFAQFKPIEKMDPALLAAHQRGTLQKRGRPKLDQCKEVISIRLNPEIISALRAQGRGWQTQLNAFLYEAYVKGNPRPRV